MLMKSYKVLLVIIQLSYTFIKHNIDMLMQFFTVLAKGIYEIAINLRKL